MGAASKAAGSVGCARVGGGSDRLSLGAVQVQPHS